MTIAPKHIARGMLRPIPTLAAELSPGGLDVDGADEELGEGETLVCERQRVSVITVTLDAVLDGITEVSGRVLGVGAAVVDLVLKFRND